MQIQENVSCNVALDIYDAVFMAYVKDPYIVMYKLSAHLFKYSQSLESRIL
jgi:hypothetical protein